MVLADKNVTVVRRVEGDAVCLSNCQNEHMGRNEGMRPVATKEMSKMIYFHHICILIL